MPSFSGGGAKDDKVQVAKSRIAQACLEQGYTLPEVNKIGAQLVQQVPLAKITSALDAKPPAEQWLQLQAIMQAQGIKEPAAGEVSTRLAHQVQSHARRKQLFQQSLSAESFSLCGGFFVNSDGTSTAVLTKIVPGACGIILLDRPVAEDVIRNMANQPQDELAVLSLGHQCPHPSTCDRVLRFPAQALGSEGQVLLQGCLHNLGARRVSIKLREGPSVSITSMVQCSFHAYSDEFSISPTWSDVTASPAKVLMDLFKQSGVLLLPVQPWARSFRFKGKPSTPAQCDAVQFNAMIPKDCLEKVLKSSGHHGVYVVPRHDQGQLMKGWSVVWLNGTQADIARLALGVAEQVGVVRSRDRYGLRIADDCFEGVFKHLRPDQVPRPKVTVQYLFKISPLPVGTNEPSLVQWAAGVSWTIRVIKTLGPRQWLVGTEARPPAGWLSFLGETVLVEPVQRRTVEKQVVQAGHQHLPAQPATPAAAALPDSQDPLQINDPWSAYYKRVKLPLLPRALRLLRLHRHAVLPSKVPLQPNSLRTTSACRPLRMQCAACNQARRHRRSSAKQIRSPFRQTLPVYQPSFRPLSSPCSGHINNSKNSSPWV